MSEACVPFAQHRVGEEGGRLLCNYLKRNVILCMKTALYRRCGASHLKSALGP